MRTTALFVVLVLMAGLVALLAILPTGPEVVPAVRKGIDPRAGGPPRGGPLVGRADETAAGGTDLPGDLDPGQRTVLLAPSVAGDALEVQVWADPQGRLAPGAEVFFRELAGTHYERPGRDSPLYEHWSEIAIQDGEAHVADSIGRVTLPGVREWAIVVARLPGAYGFKVVPRQHQPIETIVLGPDETLRVRVVDGAGGGVPAAALGVHQLVPVQREWHVQRDRLQARARERLKRLPDDPMAQNEVRRHLAEDLARLEAQAEAAGEQAQSGGAHLDLLLRRRSDAEGRAEVRHFQLYRREPEDWWGEEDRDRFQVGLLMPALQPVASPFAGRPVPERPVELHMPHSGSVAVRVVDHEGRLFVHPTNAELRAQGDDASSWARVTARKEQGGAAMEFPDVGLGLTLRPRVWLDDEDFTWDGPPVPGPGRPGERIVVDVPAPPDFGILTGRLVGPGGAALAATEVTLLVNGRAGRLEGEDLTSDGAGRFQLMFDLGKHQPPFTLEVRARRGHPPLGHARHLNDLANGRTIDLGDVRIGELELIAHGVLRDDLGRPVSEGTVKLQRERDSSDEDAPGEWHDEAFVVAASDEEGEYELFGAPLPGRYRIEAQAPDHFPAHSPDVVAGDEVDLTLARAARLVATLVLPEWLPDQAVRARLESVLDPALAWDEHVRGAPGQKTIAVPFVPPGFYDFSISVAGFADPILWVGALRVEAGQRDVHPRLTDLDLTRLVWRYRISALDEAGERMPGPDEPLLVRSERPGGETVYVGFPWRKSEIEIFATSPELEVIALSTSYRAQETTLAHGTSQLRFERTPPVRLSLPGLRAMLGAAQRARLLMAPAGGTGLPTSFRVHDQRSGTWRDGGLPQARQGGAEWLQRTDEVSIRLSRGGLYGVVLQLHAEGIEAVAVDLGTVRVSFPPRTEPVVELALDPELVRIALEQVRERQAERAGPGDQPELPRSSADE